MRRRSGFGLVEVVLSLAIMTVLLTVSMRTLSAAKRRERATLEGALGRLAAKELFDEISSLAYEEPSQSPAFGLDVGESLANRSTLDDVDDYVGLVDDPPTDRDGLPLPRFAGMERRVWVRWVSPTPPHAVAASESGLKHFTITVTDRDGRTVELNGYQANGLSGGVEL